MATHSSTLALEIPWTEEPGRLQSMGSLRVVPDWATSLSLFTSMHWRRKWPVLLPGEILLFSCLENSRDGGSCWAAIYGVTQSRTRLTWLSSSSPIFLAWLIEKTFFIPLYTLAPFIIYLMTIGVWVYFWFSIHFHWSIILFLCQYHTVLIFMISFLLLTLGCFCSSLSGCFSC